MSERTCPVCRVSMHKESLDDVALDLCPQCEGLFLDKDELNALAADVGHDIEHLTANDVDDDDRFPNRKCPQCADVTMRKMELLGYAGVVFDYCESCNGFFLDRGELDAANRELTQLSKRKLSEDGRSEIDGYLVRKDRTNMTVSRVDGPFETLHEGFRLRISVNFKRPLNAGVHLSSETFLDKLTKVLRLSKKQDIQTGNNRLDGKLIIQAASPDKAKAALGQDAVANALADYVSHKPFLMGYSTTFEMLDDSITCIGGPYIGKRTYDLEEDPDGVVKALVATAAAVDGRQGDEK